MLDSIKTEYEHNALRIAMLRYLVTRVSAGEAVELNDPVVMAYYQATETDDTNIVRFTQSMVERVTMLHEHGSEHIEGEIADLQDTNKFIDLYAKDFDYEVDLSKSMDDLDIYQDNERHHEMTEWCEDNGLPADSYFPMHRRFAFKYRDAALVFALTWKGSL